MFDATKNVAQNGRGFYGGAFAATFSMSLSIHKNQIVGRAESAGQLEIAMPAMNLLLTQGCIPDVVMALNDPTAMGAMAALEEHGLLPETMVYGVDGTPEAKNMILEGAMTATVAQSPISIGQTTAQAVYQILTGQPCASEIVAPVELITAENINAFSIEGWQ